MKLYFECSSGISGDMAVASLLDLGADKVKLEKVLDSLKLDNEFKYEISKKSVNAIMATDFDVRLPDGSHPEDGMNNNGMNEEGHHHHNHDHHLHHDHSHHHSRHEHRNLDDVCDIISQSCATDGAKNLAKKIFKIIAEAESKVHGINIDEIHFHEVGAIDSIVDILSFSVLFDDLAPENVYFSTLTDGQGYVNCQHGRIPVPVPAVCEIVATYNIPIKISDNEGEMVTPTGAAIVAALYKKEKLPDEIIIEKIGYGAGKRPYEFPVLRVMKIGVKG